jgi:NADPH-dependent glutamate synthase beta subunit-like oxidoreductase/glutamate synthase domain-containing protein 3/Pyruvate/2-oxoacid:ferredoxin oxidoreductase delta subunit
MRDKPYLVVSGKNEGIRLDSRILDEKIQSAVAKGHRNLQIEAFGQHGLGGRLWRAGGERVHVRIEGHAGQRVGAMGFPNTHIEVMGPASDDVGWLNGGAEIVIHGHASNGVANAMAQGKVFIAGNIGARGMTMTKHNPRFDPPELWVLGSVGDYFGEFMAGGIAVVCGHLPQNPENILGYRPLVGMVGGKVFFRGPHKGFSQTDARLEVIADDQWSWLSGQLKAFLDAISQPELFGQLAHRSHWQLLVARSSHEKVGRKRRPMGSFRTEIWDAELGKGGLIGDLTDMDRSPIALLPTGELRRFVPVWENRKYAAPCEASCPTGIPVHERWRLVREGRIDEAVDLALAYTPFPATVCGYLCPNLCMSACTRQSSSMAPVDITGLGKASLGAKLPDLPPLTGKKIAVIGGGPGGISAAWQLRQHGHEATVFDMSPRLGGKIASVIPESRIPNEVVSAELERAGKVIAHIHLQQALTREDMERIREDYDFVILAAGAQKPRTLEVPGAQRMIPALTFLADAKAGKAKVGKRIVIVGAGNVGCDVASEAHRLGATDILLIDVQQPASFGKERAAAEAVGARFRFPCVTKAVTGAGVELSTGEILAADTVVVSIGDVPDLSFLPEGIETQRGFVKVDDNQQTSDPKMFAIGDMARPGLLTDAIGAGRKAAEAILDRLAGRPPEAPRPMIEKNRIHLEYFDPRITEFEDIDRCGSQCSSCGACRDCKLCVTICPQAAISRQDREAKQYEYVVDETRCIGCGFCAGACPCGVWDMVENSPLA